MIFSTTHNLDIGRRTSRPTARAAAASAARTRPCVDAGGAACQARPRGACRKPSRDSAPSGRRPQAAACAAASQRAAPSAGRPAVARRRAPRAAAASCAASRPAAGRAAVTRACVPHGRYARGLRRKVAGVQ